VSNATKNNIYKYTWQLTDHIYLLAPAPECLKEQPGFGMEVSTASAAIAGIASDGSVKQTLG